VKSAKHILVVLTEFPTVSETFILNQIVDLVERGYALTIFSYSKPSSLIVHPLFKKYELNHQTVYHFKNHSNKIGRLFYGFLFFVRHFSKLSFSKVVHLLFKIRLPLSQKIKVLYDFPLLVFQTDFDVIHAHFGYNGKKVAEVIDYFPKRPKVFLCSFHGSDLTPTRIPEYELLYQNLILKADYFTVNSIYLKDIFLQLEPRTDRVILIPESIRTDEMRPYLSEKKFNGTLDIVFCGRLVGWKGPDRAVAIIKNLVQRGYNQVVLHLIGGGELFEEIKAYVAEHELQPYIKLYGPLRQDAVFELFSKSHLFLLPGIEDPKTHRAEAQGLVIQEAQFFKLPVIVSDTGGSRYGFMDSQSGFLLPNGATIDEYADALERFIKDPELLKSMGDFGHDWVTLHFDSTINGNSLEQLFN
jgi:colanic acid/amylovoran biosynthesis glycosyltransferase